MDTKALRQKILDLAIRGKLVPQDPNDEPASVLLERIREQKQQMFKEGKLKKKDIKNDSIIFVGEDNLHYEKFADGTVKCIEDEIPFEVPEGWGWSRLLSLTTKIGAGSTPTGGAAIYSSSGIKFIRSQNVYDDGLVLDDVAYISEEINQKKSGSIVRAKDILLNITGGSIGRCALVPDDFDIANVNQHVIIVRLVNLKLRKYIHSVITSPYIQEQIFARQVGSGRGGLSATTLSTFLIPIPPLNEQVAIKRNLKKCISYILTIEDEQANISNLVLTTKSKILDLAIRGQLVPQNPNDEPASVLLERIRAEKEELIKQGKIKRDKKESLIFKGENNSYYIRKSARTEPIDEQFIFELPDNWEWCSLPNIARVELGKTLDRAKNTGVNHPYLRSINVYWNKVDLTDLNEMRFEPEELERYTIRRNDLLICEGGDVGRSCVWTAENEIQYQNALHRVRFYGGCNPFYFMYYMMYYESRGIIKSLCKGVTIKHLTGNILSLIPFALPPLEEQNHIVKQLKQIFSLLDSILCK